MTSFIDYPLLIINNKVKDATWVSLKSLILIFGVCIVLGVIGTINKGHQFLMVMTPCLFFVAMLLMGLLMVKYRYRDNFGEIPNLLVPLMQFIWFSIVEKAINKFFNIILTLCIYTWFSLIGTAIVFFAYSGLAN